MARRTLYEHPTPVEQWPTADQEAWAVALQPPHPLEPDVGRAQLWKASSRRRATEGYGHWIAWLTSTGQLTDEPCVERATRQRLGRYLAQLSAAGFADNTIAGRMNHLCMALTAMRPQEDLRWFQRVVRGLYNDARLVRDPVARLQPLDQVLRLAERLMHDAANETSGTALERAKLYRDGLMMALLLHRPLRLANLVGLHLGEQLQERGGCWRIRIDEAETKNGEPLYSPWPESLVEALRHYLDTYRPALLAESKAQYPTKALWVSAWGRAMGASSVGWAIRNRTADEFGTPINPHCFRHIAATTIADAEPERAAGIMMILGHRSLQTSEHHYNRAKRSAAHQRHQETVARLRRRKGARVTTRTKSAT